MPSTASSRALSRSSRCCSRSDFQTITFTGNLIPTYPGIYQSLPTGATLPKIYCVNWFRKGPDGKFVWPGYGENSRVLKWIVQRLSGQAKAVSTPIGYLPAPGSLAS